jgi:hypothetical protein
MEDEEPREAQTEPTVRPAAMTRQSSTRGFGLRNSILAMNLASVFSGYSILAAASYTKQKTGVPAGSLVPHGWDFAARFCAVICAGSPAPHGWNTWNTDFGQSVSVNRHQATLPEPIAVTVAVGLAQ